ncbi:MAG: hypothetical protein ACRCZG_02585, partial [Culicoidibacterales bacterium]
ETRNKKISVAKTGGNASKNSLKYSVGIPPTWVQQLKINQWERDIKMTLDGDKIIVEKITSDNNSAIWFELLEKRDVFRTVIETQNLTLVKNIIIDNLGVELLTTLDSDIEQAIQLTTAHQEITLDISEQWKLIIRNKA